MLKMANPSGCHARWWTRVYGSSIKSVTIVYCQGKVNANADALSCNPVGAAPSEGVGEAEVVAKRCTYPVV
jgi:hypothetical protein